MIHDGVELPKLLTVERAAEILDVDADTVRAWIEDRIIDAVRVNGIVRVLTQSIADRPGEKTPSRPNEESL